LTADRKSKQVCSDKHLYLSCKPARQCGFLRKCCYLLRRVGFGDVRVKRMPHSWSLPGDNERTWPAAPQRCASDPHCLPSHKLLCASERELQLHFFKAGLTQTDINSLKRLLQCESIRENKARLPHRAIVSVAQTSTPIWF